MSGKEPSVDAAEVAKRIIIVRGQRVLLDSDLAELYGVTPKRLNEQVRRNRDRFPEDFVFLISISKFRALRSQFATLDRGRGRHRKHAVVAFTKSLSSVDERTRKQYAEVYAAIRALMAQPVSKSRPIGFTADLEKL